ATRGVPLSSPAYGAWAGRATSGWGVLRSRSVPANQPVLAGARKAAAHGRPAKLFADVAQLVTDDPAGVPNGVNWPRPAGRDSDAVEKSGHYTVRTWERTQKGY
ncbi:MAG: hypothetical protein OXN89_15720, partial [Bryobacterales bacterium]|nr:hypothetical protein [Bryobacterales bacterium]